MKKKTSLKYTVLMRDTDFSMRSTLESIGNIFMNIAGLDSERKGFGMEALRKQGYAWVALRILIDVKSYPAAFEKLKATTWIENWNKLTTQRNCVIEDSKGDNVVEISSIFTLINFNTRQAVNMQDVLSNSNYEKSICNKHLSIRSPEKVHLLTNEKVVATRKVTYSDIDCNMHVNSFRYVSWVLDTIPLEMFQKKFISEFEINYVKECHYGETVTINMEQLGDNVYAFDIRNFEGTSLNRCKLTFTDF